MTGYLRNIIVADDAVVERIRLEEMQGFCRRLHGTASKSLSVARAIWHWGVHRSNDLFFIRSNATIAERIANGTGFPGFILMAIEQFAAEGWTHPLQDLTAEAIEMNEDTNVFQEL